MTIDEFRTRAEAHKQEAGAVILAANDTAALDAARTQVWSRTIQQSFSKQLGELPTDDRRDAGRIFNDLKVHVDGILEERQRAIDAMQRGQNTSQIDLTMPSRERWRGGKHPVTIVIDEIVGIFRELGFTVALGPESDSEWYNFTSLNFPPDHPAMDMHDTLYLGEGALLRTHTSPVQVRTLQRHAPPIRILAPGTVFRRDPFDASHAPAFAQIEGLAVDEGISFVDLKATLTHFAQKFFGKTRTRFRPSYFPFTEPSAEMDVECRLCNGAGCSACKGTGWMEILGSGMVHPSVLEAAGVDSERYTGWAFGMGPGRIAMLRYGLPDIRLLYDSDVRFLEQVAE